MEQSWNGSRSSKGLEKRQSHDTFCNSGKSLQQRPQVSPHVPLLERTQSCTIRVLAYQPHHLRPKREIGYLPEVARTHFALSIEQYEAGRALQVPSLHRSRHRAVAMRINCDGEGDPPLVKECGKAFTAVAIVMFENAVQADDYQVPLLEALSEALRLRQTGEDTAGTQHLKHLDRQDPAPELIQCQWMPGVQPVDSEES